MWATEQTSSELVCNFVDKGRVTYRAAFGLLSGRRLRGGIMKPVKVRFMVMTAILSLTLSGCLLLAGGAVGAGTYAWVAGNLKTTYDAALPQTWEAARQAVQYLDMKTSVEEQDAFSGNLKGTMADGREFTIRLAKVTEQTTEVAVRIGLGDRDVSETIHSRIAANLRR
ncbi:MAG: DUF3568 family protein [Spirochaetaceae bacterium]|nr:MAG: DUF3568 family protein [Spirochaetaceae bacterium]